MTSTTAPAPPGAASTRTEAMRKGRQADSARRRQRVIAALNRALDDGTRQLEKRLSEALGEQAWRESGLGAPADTDALNQKVTHLEQQAIDLRLQLGEREQDLAAARAANRELMAQLNATARRR
jgi:hypothetical protein